MKFFLILFILFSVHAKKKTPPKPVKFDWSKEALKLTGESDLSRDKALKTLRTHPNIKKLLKAQLQTSKQALALDVISALQYRNFIPQLLKIAPEDETGGVYLTVNTLLTPKNAGNVIASYQKNLEKETQPASIVVILDTFGALAVPLPHQQLQAFLKNDSFEVRSATVSYVRSLVLRHQKKQYASLLKDIFMTSPYQLRIQGIYLASELGSVHFSTLLQDLKTICLKDYQKPVLEACQEKLKAL